ncbi:uncharacterized protein LOC126835807 [Adelges cooleyi]|uniref:uncharacterized protein LOC126835807 n=1 Tax=Adelges cooleyi TaxID=133065 RepID=UPI00217FECDA|nr:uncharacterized protein LOC126835807 [Adelges cooleyi]
MTARLTECVYAKAILDYLSLIRLVLHLSSREGKLVSNKLRCRKYYHKIHKTKNPKVLAPPLNYDRFWDMLDLALGKIGNIHIMFGIMIDALSFLQESLNKLRECPLDSNIQLIMKSMYLIYNAKLTVEEYNGDNRKKYNSKISRISTTLEIHFKRIIVNILIPFTNEYCEMLQSANTSEPQTLVVHHVSVIYIFEEAQYEIEKLINKVINNYYRELGFPKEEILL